MPTVAALRQPREPRNKLPVKLNDPHVHVCEGAGQRARHSARSPPSAPGRRRAQDLVRLAPYTRGRGGRTPAGPASASGSPAARARPLRPLRPRPAPRSSSRRSGKCGLGASAARKGARRGGRTAAAAPIGSGSRPSAQTPPPLDSPPCLVLPRPEGSGALPLTTPAGAGARLWEAARLGAERGCLLLRPRPRALLSPRCRSTRTSSAAPPGPQHPGLRACVLEVTDRRWQSPRPPSLLQTP